MPRSKTMTKAWERRHVRSQYAQSYCRFLDESLKAVVCDVKSRSIVVRDTMWMQRCVCKLSTCWPKSYAQRRHIHTTKFHVPTYIETHVAHSRETHVYPCQTIANKTYLTTSSKCTDTRCNHWIVQVPFLSTFVTLLSRQATLRDGAHDSKMVLATWAFL